jgi:hypothetical protein
MAGAKEVDVQIGLFEFSLTDANLSAIRDIALHAGLVTDAKPAPIEGTGAGAKSPSAASGMWVQKPAPPPASRAGQPQLQPYTSIEGRFTVAFPGGTPKLDTETVNMKDGGTTTLYEFWTEPDNGNLSYMVMYNDYAADYGNGDPQTVLATTRDGALAGKTLLSDMVISLNGVPGREFTAKDDTWNYTLRQFLQGKRLYQLIVVSTAAHPATQTSAFMDSFKIN